MQGRMGRWKVTSVSIVNAMKGLYCNDSMEYPRIALKNQVAGGEWGRLEGEGVFVCMVRIMTLQSEKTEKNRRARGPL